MPLANNTSPFPRLTLLNNVYMRFETRRQKQLTSPVPARGKVPDPVPVKSKKRKGKLASGLSLTLSDVTNIEECGFLLCD